MCKLPLVFLRVGVLKELQYRINFFLQLLQSLISLFVGLFVLALVFEYTPNLDGWSNAELLAVMGVYTLMGGILRASIQPNMLRLMDEIQQGTLDFALAKPVDSQVIISVRELQIWQLVDVIVGTIVFGWAITEMKESIGIEQSLIFVGLLMCGTLMIYAFWLILTTGAFWVVRMDQISELFSGIYTAGRWPVGIYPDWLRTGLTFIVPIAFAVTVPSEAITGRLTLSTMILTVILTILLLIISRWFFRFGLRKYSGASS